MLIVEDNELSVQVLSHCLFRMKEFSFEAHVVGSLEEALKAAETTVFDAIFLDLGLPESRSLVTLKCVDAIVDELTQIIVISDQSDDFTKTEFFGRGFRYFIAKHELNPLRLCEMLKDAIQRLDSRPSTNV